MKPRLVSAVAAAFVTGLCPLPGGFAQPSAPPPAAEAAKPVFTDAELDQLVAPVALYPDPLLSEILMASTYPVEVVEADRWRRIPDNAALADGALSGALEQERWDPSVKSLTPFPQVLKMMDDNLDWTERLGEAFIADPAALMDAVQRLRRQAQAAGKLASNAQEAVTDEDGEITIEPANAQTVYVPDYNPQVVFVPWPYPDWPPDYFPGYFGDCVFGDFGYCWFPVPIFLPLWGWQHWDWRHHQIDIDRGRFTALNHGQAPPGGEVWQHTPSHRHGVPYQTAGSRDRFPTPADSGEAQRTFRGFPAIEQVPSRAPPSFESYGRGSDVRSEAARGAASRTTPPAPSGSRGGSFGGARGGGMGGSGSRR